MNITVLIPAFNEAKRLGKTIEAVKKIELVTQIVVVDDGSTDKTTTVAKNYAVKLVSLSKNQGKGQALNAGWQAFPADIYLLIDADLQDCAQLAEALLTPLLVGEADMAIANFTESQVQSGQGKMGFGFAKSLARWGIKRMTNYTASSPLSGQRAIRKEILEKTGGFASDFGVEVALTIKALQGGFRLIEIGIPMTHRATGRNLAGFKHRGRQLWAIIKVLIKAWRNN